jgi:N-acetylneuraminic acid mutarotase
LRYGTSYLATLTSGIKDLAGNPIAANYAWTFSTVAPGTGTWRSTAPVAATARSGHSAIWTGTQMIVWGGLTASNANVGDGFRYDPNTDQWIQISGVGAPSARFGHIALWTGTEMIVWGGRSCTTGCDGFYAGVFYRSDGARYNAATDTWLPMSSINAPSRSNPSTAVWTGNEMIVWNNNTVAKYDPVADAWTPLAAPEGFNLGEAAVWTGEEFITPWGRWSSAATPEVGAAYNPSTNAWRALSALKAPPGRSGHTVVWTGSEVILWGGYASIAVADNTGAAYNPKTDTWRTLSNCGASPRAEHTAVWTGTEMIVWGGSNANTGQAYNPVTNSWRQLAVVNAPSARWGHRAVWTGTTMIVWGGGDQYLASQYDSGGSYAP